VASADKNLLAHNNAKPAAPALRQTNARTLQIGREKTKECVRGRVEAKRRSYKINEGRSRLQFDPRKISVAHKIVLFQVMTDTQPVAGSLQRQVNVFAGF
jgi:hypothetical protein